jgi:hypothetical protein
MRVFIAAFAVILTANAFRTSTSDASYDKKTRRLVENLFEMRTSIDVYKAHHQQLPPTESFEKFHDALVIDSKSFPWWIEKIPENPFNGLNTIRFDGKPAGYNRAGYRLDTKTGHLQADNSPGSASL